MTISAKTGEDLELEALYRDLAAVDLQPLWTITEQLLPATPQPKTIPWLWSAATMKPLARRAIQLVPVERGGERRVLSLQNPGLAGRPGRGKDQARRRLRPQALAHRRPRPRSGAARRPRRGVADRLLTPGARDQNSRLLGSSTPRSAS